MTEIRKLGFDPHTDLLFFDTPQHYGATDPTPAEVADLLARVLGAAGYNVRSVIPMEGQDADWFLDQLLDDVGGWRAALARESAQAAEDREVEALGLGIYRKPLPCPHDLDNREFRNAVARHFYELGARPNGGA